MLSQFIARFVKLTHSGSLKPVEQKKPYYTAVPRQGYIDGVLASTHENITL
jgi:hypothetical protein